MTSRRRSAVSSHESGATAARARYPRRRRRLFPLRWYHGTFTADGRRLRPMSLAALMGKVEGAAWREKPATYALCIDDRAVPVALQHSNAARIDNTVAWPTSHSPFLSRPDLVTDLLLELSSS